MDDEQCAVCGRPAGAGRLYCSAACKAAEASSSPPASSRSQSPEFARSHRRAAHSMDQYISASDRETSSAASSSARLTSPPSSLEDSEYPIHKIKIPLSPDGLLFARRPSQTNNRATVPPVLLSRTLSHKRTASQASAMLDDVGRTPGSPLRPVTGRLNHDTVRARPPKHANAPASPRSPRSPGAFPAQFARMMKLSPASTALPLVTRTSVDTHGEARPVTPQPRPMDRSTSAATVRLAARVPRTMLISAVSPPEDGDASEVEDLMEPIRGRGRTRARVRRDSAPASAFTEDKVLQAPRLRRLERERSPRDRRLSMRY